MIAYLGQTRAAPLVELLKRHGIREMVVRGELPPRRWEGGFAYDPGGWRDHQAGAPFDVERFRGDLDWLHLHARTRPDFLVAPDVVAGGLRSLALSTSWLPELLGRGLTVYLAVQDGMTEADVVAALPGFGGIFVGGTTEWKLATGHLWVQLAHARGLKCHLARVSSKKRIRWAMAARADSIDTCQPLRSAPQLERFLRALREPELPLVYDARGVALA